MLMADDEKKEMRGAVEIEICDYCGGEGWPDCCPHTFACGSEECDWCGYSDECEELASEVERAK